jgi:hypothetical protein
MDMALSECWREQIIYKKYMTKILSYRLVVRSSSEMAKLSVYHIYHYLSTYKSFHSIIILVRSLSSFQNRARPKSVGHALISVIDL